VNQRVAQRMLQKLAADVTIANNGAEALERLAESTYDAVLMDCQMPVMDGFTATRRIREPSATRRRQTPAHHRAHRQCHERRPRELHRAGMDAHLGKPIEPAQLVACLGRYLKRELPPRRSRHGALRDLTGGDAEFERELVDTFIASGDQCLAEIVHALRVSDFATIGKRAHALKGASANIHAAGLAAAASTLESAARASVTVTRESSGGRHSMFAERHE
jgi:two-component system sensor histidine kinase/response regulator